MSGDVKILETSDSWMYVSNNKSIWYELTEIFMLFWFSVSPLLVLVYYFSKDSATLVRASALFLGLCIITLIRRRTTYLSLFMLLNIIVAGLAYLIGYGLLEKITFTAYIVIWIIISIRKKYEEVIYFLNIMTLLWGEVVIGVSFIAAYNLKLTLLQTFLTTAGILEAVICLVYIYLIRTRNLMEWEVKYAKKFSGRVRKLKITSGAVISGCSLILLGLVWKTGILNLMDILQNKIMNIFKLADNPPKQVVQNTPPPVQANNNEANALSQLDVKGNNNPFVIFIMKLIELAITILAIAAVIYLLWMLILKIRDIYRGFYRKRPESYEKREIIITSEEIKKDLSDRVRTIRNDIQSIFDRSNRKRIRKMYFKTITHYKSKGIEIVPSSTPVELEYDIMAKAAENVGEATKLYEKARYSSVDCTDEDVNRMKKYYK